MIGSSISAGGGPSRQPMVELSLDVTGIEINDRGVEGFVWPVGYEEIRSVGQAVLAALAEEYRIYRGAPNEEQGDLLSIVAPYLIGEAMSLFQAYAVTRRLEGLPYISESGNGRRLVAAVIQGNKPEPPSLMGLLRSGVPAYRRIGRQTLYELRQRIEWNGMSVGTLSPWAGRSDIIAIQGIPLVAEHARTVDKVVRLRPPPEWFGPLSAKASRDAMSEIAGSPAVSSAVSVVRAGFDAGNEQLPPFLEDYLNEWLSEAVALTDAFLRRLLRTPTSLPDQLWTGSGGQIWARTLRYAVRRAGGAVVGHDHSRVSGYLTTLAPTISELESCDVFVTYSEAHAKAFERGIRTDLLPTSAGPRITSITTLTGGRSEMSGDRRSWRSRPAAAGRPIRRVMYPSIFYMGERVLYYPMLPDLVAIDWQARLISHLHGWGYQMILKPHPGSNSLPPAQFADQMGAELETGRFENVMDRADAFLFDQLNTTVLSLALATSKPIVIIDYRDPTLTPEARELLRNRCSIVQGWFDDENRVQVDWEDLRSGIKESEDLMDTAFAKEYLS